MCHLQHESQTRKLEAVIEILLIFWFSFVIRREIFESLLIVRQVIRYIRFYLETTIYLCVKLRHAKSNIQFRLIDFLAITTMITGCHYHITIAGK